MNYLFTVQASDKPAQDQKLWDVTEITLTAKDEKAAILKARRLAPGRPHYRIARIGEIAENPATRLAKVLEKEVSKK